jgi:carbon monoxide dehydrogenase subunit G
MKLEGDYSFEAGIQEVWDALFDPAVLAAVMPGCEKLELVDGSYLGEIKVKVGPIQGKFSGKVDLSDMVEPKSYKMVVDGKGSTGFVKATATIALESVGTGTKVTYDAEAQVGGKIASVGQRLVETSAKAIVKQSLEGLAENIKIRSAAYRAHAVAVAATPVPAPVLVAPKPVVQEAESVIEAVADVVKAIPEVVMPTELAKPEAAAPKLVPAVSAPVIEYKKADAGKLAGAVAKEVTKTLAPILLVVAVVIALVIYLFVR